MEDYEILNSPGYLLNKGNWCIHTYFSQEIRKLGYKVTPEQWGILGTLYNSPGITQIELSKASLKDKTTITRLLDTMGKHNLIERKSNSVDRRSFNIFPTETGKKLFLDLLPVAIKVNKASTESISKDDYEQFKKVTLQIMENIKNIL